jgi:aerobic-type carbon monoxide dehydrogenase small subunit (CoxS/CutS family)
MTEEKKGKSGEISRREFLRDAGLLVGGTAIGSAVLLAACGGENETVTSTKTVTTTAAGGTVTTTKTVEVPAEGAAENVINLTVNGRQYELQVEPNMTLQDMLREKLGLTSPKDMCFGFGACGSCSVIMDGRPILSCMALATECDGAIVETAEGIADANHPIVDAYIVNHCMQCGYCTPGFLVTAKALLDHNPSTTEEDIRKILAGNICRCGTYPAHIRAVLEAAESL